jgi:hypothetical protein
MAPPEGSIFDPAKKWTEEKERRLLSQEADTKAADKKIATAANTAKKANKKNDKKITAESIKVRTCITLFDVPF